MITGLVELKEGRHVAMLFVAPYCQRKGIGMCLMRAALEHGRGDWGNGDLPNDFIILYGNQRYG